MPEHGPDHGVPHLDQGGVVDLTPAGRTLRDQAGRAAHEVDAELLRDLDPGLRKALGAALAQIGAGQGLSYS